MELLILAQNIIFFSSFVLHDQAELRASVFEAIEEEDRVIEENEDGGNPALLGSCNDRAKQLHASPSGLCFQKLPSDWIDKLYLLPDLVWYIQRSRILYCCW